MKISVILAHPYNESFNHAIASKVTQTLKGNGHFIYFHDLYGERFEPVITPEELISDKSEDPLIIQHWKEIKETDGIIIIHPNWWGQPPAILKGWIDRVLRENIAYTFPEGDNGGGLPIGLLKAKIGLVFNTSNTPKEREENVFGDPLHRIWKDCIFDFCGITKFDRKMFRVIAGSADRERKKWLNEVVDMVNKYFPKKIL
ncbi:NAD(P)H-dependent oxidoreductase [Dysgonomonas termitidis]|uniref:NAD(P)H-dependent oxidoreductase n=1 Tax=Dysgonomonas termitidis TaxID=1516126 RepID=A0ABV9KTX2_9BACT